MLKSFVEFAAYGVAAILAAVCIFVWAWKWSGWSWSVVSRQLRRSVLAMMVVLAVVATIEAQKRSGNEATGVSLPRGDPPVGEAALLPLPATNTLHFSSIAVPTSGTVALTAAWPENFLTAGQTLDVLGKENLRDETWTWLTNGVVEAGSTNMTWTIENQSPSNSFYKAVVRESFTDMDDPDGDGLPNVYELAHGMNPWLNDYAHVQKLTVGPNGAITSTPPVMVSRTLFDASFTNVWPLARFENAGGFSVTMTDCILPSEPALPDFMPDVTNDMHIVTSQVAWAGFPLADSPAAALGVGAFAPLANDPLADMDNDGISDYEEVFDYGTDPFLTDSDNDGILDDVEIFVDHTDPTNPHSFKQNLTVTVTNKASAVSTVYTAWGISNVGWEVNGVTAFPEGFGTTNYVDASSQGATHIKAFCDFNGNGTFDADYDILRVRSIPPGSTARVDFVFGDVDDDGVSDAQERQQGTDPYDGNNFRLVATVKIENSDVVPSLTNFVAWGYSAAGWEPNDLARFAGTSLTFPVNASVIGGELFVKVFRDFNANGVYDVDVDALVSNRLTRADNGKTVTFNIGDSDGDKISDSVELAEGTNPLDKRNYCFNLSLTYTDVFQTTNALTFAASFGTNRVYGPCVVEGNVWSNDFGHRSTTTGEHVSVDVWDDMNRNGEWDSGETSNKYVIAVTGHNMVMTNKLAYKNFDRNYNELPDWWDVQEGLDADGVARRMYDDPDGDGLINLHEFWCGTHPLVPDGSDTLLSVAARSIDDRIRDVDSATSISRFVNYFANAASNIFIANTNFWARELDLSCVSVWHSGGNPESKAATLITRKHVVMAQHWYNNGQYVFCDTNGNVCVRSLVDNENVFDDLCLGRLNEALPESFTPAKVLPLNFERYLSTAKYLPVLCLNHHKCATVQEVTAMNLELTDKYGRHHCLYTGTSQTNLVSSQRIVIRGSTVDGNSGCPVFLVVGNELVLIFSKHLGWQDVATWSPYYGPMLSFQLTTMQNKIDEWEGEDASQYQICPIDLSAYGEIENLR